jgi:hypothetical protein
MSTAVPRRSRFALVALIAVTSVVGAGCRRHAASAAECASVLDRLVEMELTESGYRDQILRARWQQDLGRRFAPDLERCRGQAVRDDLSKCLVSAHTSEEVTHRCLE